MRRRRHELHRWERWKDGSFTVVPVEGGVIVDYRVSEVHAPFVSSLRGQERKIFDVGFRWVYFTPLAECHSVIVALNESNTPLQIYVDVTQENRVDPDGFPAIDDVFLDVLAWFKSGWELGEPEVIDQHELVEAVAAGVLCPVQAQAAWAEARRVVDMVRAGHFPALDTLREYVQGGSCSTTPGSNKR